VAEEASHHRLPGHTLLVSSFVPRKFPQNNWLLLRPCSRLLTCRFHQPGDREEGFLWENLWLFGGLVLWYHDFRSTSFQKNKIEKEQKN
jgi:hypothetical protein